MDINVFLSSQYIRHKLTKYNTLKYLFTYLFFKWKDFIFEIDSGHLFIMMILKKREDGQVRYLYRVY